MTNRPRLAADFRAGAQTVLPVLIGILPFALIAGVVAVRLGFSPWLASALSVLVFAGAAQLATMQLLFDGAPLLIILITVFFINLRFMMYSASIAPHFRGASAGTRAGLAYFLTDQPYVFGVYGFAERPMLASRIAFYLGVALPLWCCWQLGTIVGAQAGARLPEAWNLEFAIPLVFLAMIVPAIRDKASIAAAVAGGIVAVAGHGLPWNLGLIGGALTGIASGVVVSLLMGDTEADDG
ncbi:AzlC family protein [Salinisphaera sp. C84B14]|uniref:AzlC family ABC transporter permease n=1 Tax=Salinisphaera sp. C84B14 TaxID=1304155 RepID=UPI00334108B4